jgi:hypothetical protein
VLDYAEQMLPGYNIPYDYTSATMAACYYQLGDTDKANAIMTKIADNCLEYLAWGASLTKEQRPAAQSTISHHNAVMNYVLQNFERFLQKEHFNKYYQLYLPFASR